MFKGYIGYVLSTGQDISEQLSYAKLPDAVQKQGEAALAQLTQNGQPLSATTAIPGLYPPVKISSKAMVKVPEGQAPANGFYQLIDGAAVRANPIHPRNRHIASLTTLKWSPKRQQNAHEPFV